MKNSQTRFGFLFAFCAYCWWGFAPIYWKFLDHVPAVEILGHRMVWSLALLALYQTVTRNWGWLKEAITNWNLMLSTAIAAVMLALNAGLFTWGINNGRILDTSLGYFINPLFIVLAGYLVYKEEVRKFQWLAIGIAGLGVLYLTFVYGQFPWLGLTLACAFTLYGVFKKRTTLGTFESMTLEMGLMFPFFLLYLLTLENSGAGNFTAVGAPTTWLLIFGGLIAIGPYLFFSAATSRIPLLYVGIMQYIGPSISFLLGVFLYNEPLNTNLLVGFCFVWVALVIFSFEGIFSARLSSVRPPAVKTKDSLPVS
ncbi:MAG: EamA family transporter RarD [Chloroflexota bacterium]